MNNELTEQYLNDTYGNVMSEHSRLLNELKNSTNQMEKHKEGEITRQLSLLNTLATNVLRLRNLKQQIKLKADI